MTAENPLIVTADTVARLFGQTDFSLHKLCHTLLAPRTVRLKRTRFGVEAKSTPCTILAIEKLVPDAQVPRYT